MMSPIRLLAAALLSTTSVAGPANADDAYGLTVFRGTTPERFAVEVLDVLPGALGPDLPMILVRLTGAAIEHTGVIRGMSGSPVYRDGKLLGAVGYRIGQFSKEALAGVTPAAAMLALLDRPEELATAAADPVQIATPLVITGVSSALRSAAGIWLEERGMGQMIPVAGGGLAAGSPAAPKALESGGGIGVVLARGDINAFGLGTVTFADDRRFVAFGHPMFGVGAINLPVATVYVSTTVPSPANAYKVGRLGANVGRLTQDRLPGIAGVIGGQAPVIPIAVTLPGGRTVRSDLSWQRHILPTIARTVVASAFRDRSAFEAGGTVHMTGSIDTGRGAVRLDEWFGHPDSTGIGFHAAARLAEFIGLLVTNPIAELRPKAIEVKLAHNTHTNLYYLRQIRLLTPQVRAGQEVEVSVRLRTYQGGWRNLRLRAQIPDHLAGERLQLVVGAGARIDWAHEQAGRGGPPSAADDIVPWLNRRTPENRLQLLVARGETRRAFGPNAATASARLRGIAAHDADATSADTQIVERSPPVDLDGPILGLLISPVDVLED
jgi:hypothetical protein